MRVLMYVCLCVCVYVIDGVREGVSGRVRACECARG